MSVLIGSRKARVVVIDEAGTAVAFAVTTTGFGMENGIGAELEELYVIPAARRRGLAGRLIEDSADWARQFGATQLDVVTAPNGRDISHLYAYYGAHCFVDDGRRLLARTL